MGSDAAKVCGALFCFAVTIASIVMFGCSFDTINPHQVGLHYNGPTYHLYSKTYNNGRYFLGLGHTFVKYPRSMIYFEFSYDAAAKDQQRQPIIVWTNDGQEILIEFGFYIQLDSTRLADLYYKYSTKDYQKAIVDIAINAVRDITTTYNTQDFFTKRLEINAGMLYECQLRVAEQVYANVPDFNLLSITVPDAFDAAVLNKVITQQLQATLEFTQQAQEIRANTNVTVSTFSQYLIVQQANFAANATLLVQAANADAFLAIATAKAQMLKDVALSLNFTVNGSVPVLPDSTPLLKFLYTDLLVQLSNAPSTAVAVDFQSALLHF